MAQSYLILKKTEETSQVVMIIPQRSSAPLISPALTSSWQAFSIFFLLALQQMGQKFKLHIWLSYTWKLRKSLVWLKRQDRKSK